MAWVKGFLKKTVAHLTETNKERVPEFKKGATEFVKWITDKEADRFGDFQFFCGTNFEIEASICFAYNKDGEAEPTFLFFMDALKANKY
jgi:hypothetical protein